MVTILQISIVMKPLQCNTLYICWTCTNLYTYKLYLHRRMWALLLKRINLGPHIVQLIDPSDHAEINDTCANHTSSPCIIMSSALQLLLTILRFSSWHDSSGYIVLEVTYIWWSGRNYRQRIAMRQLHLMFKDSIGTEQLHESQKEVRDLNEKCPKVLRSATYLVASTASLSSS